MTSSNCMVQPIVPLFDGKNFERWNFQMKVFFEFQEILEVVERGVPPLVENATESQRQALKDAEKKDVKALYFIHQGVNNVIFEKIARARTAKAAWRILQYSYNVSERVRESGEVHIPIPEPSIPALDGSHHSIQERKIPYSISNDGKRRDEYLNLCVPLYRAAMNGNWKAAEAIIDQYPDIVCTAITNKEETALHIAAAAKHKHFVKKLVKRMEKDYLELKNQDSNTAICFAAASGVVDIAKVMVDENQNLPLIRGSGGVTPLHLAALFGHRKMVLYLYENTKLESLEHQERINLFHVIISAEIYDVALKMLKSYSSLATSRDGFNETALHLMARKPSAISSKSQLGFVKKIIHSGCKRVFHGAWMRTQAHQLVEELWKQALKLPDYEVSDFIREPSRLLFDAAALGNYEFLMLLLHSYPDLIWKVDSNNRSLFHVAAINRHERIFNIVYELGAIKDLIVSYKEEETRNTMLHLVASLPPPERLQVVSGAALQMQRELLWFEAVKKIVPISYIKMKNKEGEVAQELFAKHHKELQKEGEKWMRDTATSCMLVATLVATVVFAAAFTVPGGNEGQSGIPILRRDKSFDIFVLSDAVALFTSSFAVVIFLSVLTSRYAETDFRVWLPLKLTFGLLALFISISTMVLAFSASLFLIYDQKFTWIPILIISLASVTTLAYVLLHGRLLFDTIGSTFWSKILFQTRRRRLYR